MAWAGLLVACNSLRMAFYSQVRLLAWTYWQGLLGRAGSAVIAGVVLVLAVILIVRGQRRAFRYAQTALLILSPSFVANLGMAAWKSIDRGAPARGSTKLGSTVHLGELTGKRVIFLLFDEWDYRLTFIDRKKGFDLPTLDAVWADSAVAAAATPVADSTRVSVPALTTGLALSEVRMMHPGNALLEGVKGWYGNWGDVPSIFSDAREAGKNIELIGWYLPYCRNLGQYCSSCEWWEGSFVGFPRAASLPETLGLQWHAIFEGRGTSLFGQPIQHDKYERTHRQLTAELRRATRDGSVDLLYAHLPVLHEPYYYNEVLGDFSMKHNWPHGYWSGLRLLDQLLSLLLEDLQGSGLAGRTVIIATSDHSLRAARFLDGKTDRRVPYFVLMPERRQAASRGKSSSMSWLGTRAMLQAVWSGEIRDESTLLEWARRAESAR
jgi:hypothetical protein